MAGKKGCGRKPILPEPEPRACEWCDLIFTPLRKKWRQRFCGLVCQRAAIGIVPGRTAPVNSLTKKAKTPSQKPAKHMIGPKDSAEFRAWRAQKNAEIARETAWKRGNTQRGSGEGKTYRKLMGRHAHRVIAEMMLGRELRPGEVVHHINGNIRDNSEDNLQVLPSQAVHASIHGGRRHQDK